MPYGGVNGTLEALDAGVPVVTLLGKRHGERTILFDPRQSGRHRHGRDERHANTSTSPSASPTDAAFMRDVRRRIRDGLSHSPLTDRVAHTRALERAYLAALSAKAPEVLRATNEKTDG